MGNAKFNTIKRQPLNVTIYENIKEAIIKGEIEPGTRLTETGVSEQMSVSTTPVREAFRRLSSEGFLTIVPFKGAIVKEYSSEVIVEVYQCREALEALSIELAIDNIDENGIEQLESYIIESKTEKNLTRYVEINSKIHDTILNYANNKTLNNLLEQLNEVIYHHRNVSSYSDCRRKEIHDEHVAIINAMKEKNKQKANQAMKTHIRNGFSYIVEQLSEEKK